MSFQSFTAQLCRQSLHSFSEQLCTESFERLIAQPQLDLATSLSLQQLRQKNSQLHSAQLSFPKFSKKNLESLSDQLCRHHSESLIDKRQYRFQSFSFQISSSSLGSGTLNQLSAEINKFLEKNFGQHLAENGLQQNLFQDQQQLQDSNLAQKMFQQLNLEQPAAQEHLSQLRLQDPASASSRQLPEQQLDKRELQHSTFSASSLEAETFRKATSAATAFQKRLLPRQLFSQRELQSSNFSDRSFEKKRFRQAASETAAWQQKPSEQQLRREHL